MSKELRRAEIIEGTAAYILRQGLGSLSLRPLAAELGTSDRMLLHYFSGKDELVVAALERCLADMLKLIKAAVGDRRLTLSELVAAAPGLVRHPGIRPYLRLWLELASTRGSYPDESARRLESLARDFHAWIGSILEDDGPQPQAGSAAAAFAVIEGYAVLEALGQARLADEAATYLSGELGRRSR